VKYFDKLKTNWERFAKNDPLCSILTDENKKDSHWDIDDFFETGIVEIKDVMELIEANGISMKYEQAVDFGCGVGRLTQAMSSYFGKVFGIDISQQMINKANDLNKSENCSFCVVDNPNFQSIDDSQIDFIYSNITLQHIRPNSVFEYLDEFKRILKNGGLLVFQMPDKYHNDLFGYFRENIFIYNLYLNVKYLGKAKMETYCVRKGKIIRFMSSLGFELKLAKMNQNAGPKWKSYTYYFIKK
jgi:ubiquinone/menaquinone biosynthesis C-methylase UbiE